MRIRAASPAWLFFARQTHWMATNDENACGETKLRSSRIQAREYSQLEIRPTLSRPSSTRQMMSGLGSMIRFTPSNEETRMTQSQS